jgi:hypothetical protein
MLMGTSWSAALTRRNGNRFKLDTSQARPESAGQPAQRPAASWALTQFASKTNRNGGLSDVINAEPLQWRDI